MASALSSLGIGSDGVLSYDIIDQLKEADKKTQISPIDSNLEENQVKQEDLSSLTTLAATLKSSTSTLADELSYLQRTSSSSDDAVSVAVEPGADIQDFSVRVNSLAQNDIYQSKTFSSQTALFASGDDTLTFKVGDDGTTHEIDVSAATTLSELKEKINNDLDGIATASILNVGEDQFRLVIKGDETGNKNSISIEAGETESILGLNANSTYTSTNDGTTPIATDGETITFSYAGNDYTYTHDSSDTSATTLEKITNFLNNNTDGNITASTNSDGYLEINADSGISVTSSSNAAANLGFSQTSASNRLQSAGDANFDFNGVNITRATNSIDDIVVGVDIKLNSIHQGSEKANISVTQDWTTAKESLRSFVGQYNDLMNNLNEATKYDRETNTAGTFQGSSEVTGLKSAIGREILNVDEFGRSLIDYGIKLNDSDMLEFDESKLDAKIAEDPKDVEDFLRGSTSYETTSLSSSDIQASDLDISGTDFSINGTQIAISTTGNTQSENALAVLEAINNTNISGVEAFMNPNGTSIRLEGNAGVDIEVSGNPTKLNSIGLSAQNIQAESNSREGMFTSFNSLMGSYIDSSNGMLGIFEDRLQNEQDSLQTERQKAVASLDTKYETMASRFAAYDSMINKLNTQFQSLSKMIDAQANNN